jgi:hypothetical protein
MRLAWHRQRLPEDRRVLEEVIFVQYRRDPRVRTVLFVGCASYTAHYQDRHFASHDYWTLDAELAQRRFGARQHVTARLETLTTHFPLRYFDLIICNGVYGWGLNRREDCEIAFAQCAACLADGGQLVLGWNDLPKWDPAPLAEVRSLAEFAEDMFPPLGTCRYVTGTPYRHTYNFYRIRAL